MNWVYMRRMALICASAAFGVLTCLMIVVGSTPRENIQQGMIMPYNISCTSISVNRLVSYDGPFYEDGTGREVMNIAALEICNFGDVVIPYACIMVSAGGEQYTFQATMIPVDTPVLVQESNAQPYFTDNIDSIFGWNTVRKCKIKPPVTVEETAMAELSVTNDSANVLKGLKVYYRTYYSEGNVYCGGKAFSVCIDSILPGETKKLYPEHYVSGYSRIVCYE